MVSLEETPGVVNNISTVHYSAFKKLYISMKQKLIKKIRPYFVRLVILMLQGQNSQNENEDKGDEINLKQWSSHL